MKEKKIKYSKMDKYQMNKPESALWTCFQMHFEQSDVASARQCIVL